jgi:hypothetical protein
MNFWIGTVVNVNDPHQSGRVQVRVMGRHDDNVNIPDNMLPWALLSQPTTSAALGKIGTAPVGLLKGSRVHGFWLDSDQQYPLVLGSLGKSGDLIPGRTIGGAPAVNTSFGSIPGPSQSTSNSHNPYSSLFSGRTLLTAIDNGTANIFSVVNNIGSIITQDIERNMRFGKLPTTASVPVTNKNNVLTIINSIDPLGLSQALPCLSSNFNLVDTIMGLVSSVASSLRNILALAVQNAILQLAQKFGIFKVLNALNSAAYAIAEMKSIINSLNISLCGDNLINQGLFNSANYIFGSAINTINQATGFVYGALDSVNQAVTGAAVGVFDTIVTAPLASVATTLTASPLNTTIVTSPPSSYIQYYSSNDPYPGYITWIDTYNQGPTLYTLRNGQPNFTSSSDHTNYMMSQNVSSSLETALIGGNLNGDFLSSLASKATDTAKSFAISTVLGAGFSLLNAGISAALLPLPTQQTLNTFNNSVTKAPEVNSNATNATNDFTQQQALLSKKKAAARTALTPPSGDLPIPTIPPDNTETIPLATEDPTPQTMTVPTYNQNGDVTGTEEIPTPTPTVTTPKSQTPNLFDAIGIESGLGLTFGG